MASSPPPCWTGGNPISNNVEDYVFFLSKDATPYGCFSNAFRERDDGHLGLRSGDGPFWCVNQELHYRKAMLFDDEEVASLILAERKDASKIKQHGRMVKRYDDEEWVKNRYDIAREAIESKFLSDETLKKILLDTRGKIIVEAATDRAWGVGVIEFSTTEEKGAKKKDGSWDVHPKHWSGQNILGRCLMDVRDKLLSG